MIAQDLKLKLDAIARQLRQLFPDTACQVQFDMGTEGQPKVSLFNVTKEKKK